MAKYYQMQLEGNVIHCTFSKGLIIDEEVLRQAVKDRVKLAGRVARPIFIDAQGVEYYTWNARIFGSSNEAQKDVLAYAIVVNSRPLNTLINWVLAFMPPKRIPSKVFNKKEEAIEWLNQFKA